MRLKMIFLIVGLSISILNDLHPQNKDLAFEPIDISGFEDAIRHWKNGPGKNLVYERFEEKQVKEIADNLLRFQNSDGGWPKNIDWLGKLDYDLAWNRLSNFEKKSSCDNRNTYTQIEYLSKVYLLTKEGKYKLSVERGLDFILNTQNQSGGWRGADVDAITYNDDLMTGIMNLFLDIIEGKDYFNWMDKEQKERIKKSLDKSINVTLNCQIIVDGKKTGWCQQHDHITLKPIKARSYELPSIASLETTSVVEFLMRIETPDEKIIDATESAITWLEKSKITGITIKHIKLDDREINDNYKRFDKIVVEDKNAHPVWARYYEIETNIPFFCNRDGIKVYSLAEVQQERRIGYAWYGDWPKDLLEKKYPKWIKKITGKKSGKNDFPRDTSYTVFSTYQKLIESYPFIKIVNIELPEDVALERNIVYTTYKERELHLDLFQSISQNIASPAVILIHGGGWRSGDKSMMHPIAIKLAENGFIAVAVEYRLSPEAKYPAAIYDLKSSLRWLKENAEKYNIDTNKIAVLGCSAGGTLAALLGSTNGNNKFEGLENYLIHTSNVNAIIDIDGIIDFTHPAESGKDNDPQKPSAGKLWFGESFKENPELWFEASPLNYIDNKTPPTIFINSSEERFHAGRDEAIQKLQLYNTYYEIHTIKDTPHSFWLFEPWFTKTNKLILDFLNKVFK